MKECDLDRRYGLPENVCAVGGVVGMVLVTLAPSLFLEFVGVGVLVAATIARKIADRTQKEK